MRGLPVWSREAKVKVAPLYGRSDLFGGVTVTAGHQYTHAETKKAPTAFDDNRKVVVVYPYPEDRDYFLTDPGWAETIDAKGRAEDRTVTTDDAFGSITGCSSPSGRPTG